MMDIEMVRNMYSMLRTAVETCIFSVTLVLNHQLPVPERLNNLPRHSNLGNETMDCLYRLSPHLSWQLYKIEGMKHSLVSVTAFGAKTLHNQTSHQSERALLPP